MEKEGYREAIQSTVNCDVAKATFDTYNVRDWNGYQALQHPDVQWLEVEGRFFRGVDGVTEEVDNWRDAYPEASADITNLFDCGDNRVVIEWTLDGLRRGVEKGPEGENVPEKIRVDSADLMQLKDGCVYAGRTYYGFESARTVIAVQGGAERSDQDLPDTPQYRVRIDDTPNTRVAKESLEALHDGNRIEIVNLIDCGDDRVVLEWDLLNEKGRARGCDLVQLLDGVFQCSRRYYGLASVAILEN